MKVRAYLAIRHESERLQLHRAKDPVRLDAALLLSVYSTRAVQ